MDLWVTRLVVIPAQAGIHVSNWPLDPVLIGVIDIYLVAIARNGKCQPDQ